MTPYEDLPEETTPDEIARDFAVRLHTYGCDMAQALAVLLGAAMGYTAMIENLKGKSR